MGRLLLATAAALLGAVVGAGLLAMALAILFTAIWGGFEGSAAMGGVTVGLPLGAIAGAWAPPTGFADFVVKPAVSAGSRDTRSPRMLGMMQKVQRWLQPSLIFR